MKVYGLGNGKISVVLDLAEQASVIQLVEWAEATKLLNAEPHMGYTARRIRREIQDAKRRQIKLAESKSKVVRMRVRRRGLRD